MIADYRTLFLVPQQILTRTPLCSYRDNQTTDEKPQSNRMLIRLMKGFLWSVWRSASVCLGSHSENCFLTSSSRRIRRSDIEWQCLRRLIREHVVIVKEVCGILRRSRLLNELLKGLGDVRCIVFVEKMIIRQKFLESALLLSSTDISSAIAVISGTCQNIYGSCQSSCTHHGCRQFRMLPFLDAVSCRCRLFWRLLVVDASSCGCCQLWMPPSGSPSNNAANSEVLENSPWLFHIEPS